MSTTRHTPEQTREICAQTKAEISALLDKNPLVATIPAEQKNPEQPASRFLLVAPLQDGPNSSGGLTILNGMAPVKLAQVMARSIPSEYIHALVSALSLELLLKGSR